MRIDWVGILDAVVATSIFTTLGLVFFGVAFFAITKLVPFSMRKEIEQDQNVALGIIIGAVIIGIAIIISSILGAPPMEASPH
jgi:putative membrane protein